MNQLILRELNSNDEIAFVKGSEAWPNEDMRWYSFIWKPGMNFTDHLSALADQ